MFYKCFDIKTSCRATKNENMSYEELAEELHNPIIRKFEKVQSHFKDIIWGADIELISKFDKGIRC